VFYLIYVSDATRQLDEAQLMDILTVSRAANAEIGVTGLLLYKGGRFMQMLEGTERAVRDLLDKITRDPRHYNVVMLQEGTHGGRVFPDRAMGFRTLDDGATDVAGYMDFEKAELSEAEFANDPLRCMRLLRLFREPV
jgi:hypothetical protein